LSGADGERPGVPSCPGWQGRRAEPEPGERHRQPTPGIHRPPCRRPCPTSPRGVAWGTAFPGPEGDKGIPPPDRHSQQQDRGLRINEQIRISPVRLIGAGGEQLGVVPTAQAMDLAREANLDLVEVAPNERPPVCKILDYGKFRYQQSRKGTKVHQQKLKEIRVRPKTGIHDVDTKINQARRFLEHNDKVLVNVLFRGRELQHIEEGRRIIDGILEKLVDVAKVEKAPSMEGKRMTAMLAPKGSRS
jgi:translation initiation factor IF-3